MASSGVWRCNGCFVENDVSDKRCVCCEQLREGAHADGPSFSSRVTAGSSEFVFPSSTNHGQQLGLHLAGFQPSSNGGVSSGFLPTGISSGFIPSSIASAFTVTTTTGVGKGFMPNQADVNVTHLSNVPETSPGKTAGNINDCQLLGQENLVTVRATPSLQKGDKVPTGDIYVWGSGECDQLALADDAMTETMGCPIPTRVETMKGKSVTSLACGALHNVALLADGSLWSWGCNDDLPLGRPTQKEEGEMHNDQEEERFPGMVPKLSSSPVRLVACGDNHTCCITAAGDCFIWGSYKDNSGYIGFPDYAAGKGSIPSLKCMTPTRVPLPFAASQLACGENHTLVLCSNEDAFVWGSSEFGQLISNPLEGLEADKASLLFPQHRTATRLLLSQYGGIKSIFAGRATSFIVTVEGSRLFGCGRNSRGEVGIGSGQQIISELQEVEGLRGVQIKKLSGGQYFTAAVTVAGEVYSWGHQELVGLGPLKQDARVPRKIGGLTDVVSLNAGGDACFCTTLSGHVYSWGEGQMYQLGNGEEREDPFTRPYLIDPKHFDNRFVLFATGGCQHTTALVWDGRYADIGAVAPISKKKAVKKRRLEDVEEAPPSEKLEPAVKKRPAAKKAAKVSAAKFQDPDIDMASENSVEGSIKKPILTVISAPKPKAALRHAKTVKPAAMPANIEVQPQAEPKAKARSRSRKNQQSEQLKPAENAVHLKVSDEVDVSIQKPAGKRVAKSKAQAKALPSRSRRPKGTADEESAPPAPEPIVPRGRQAKAKAHPAVERVPSQPRSSRGKGSTVVARSASPSRASSNSRTSVKAAPEPPAPRRQKGKSDKPVDAVEAVPVRSRRKAKESPDASGSVKNSKSPTHRAVDKKVKAKKPSKEKSEKSPKAKRTAKKKA